LDIENVSESNLDLTLTKISSAEDYNVNYYCIRCLPARGLDLLYRESSLDIENICESSLNLTLTEIPFVEKDCDAYSLSTGARSSFNLQRIFFGHREYLQRQS
jgi:hypothetical protein